MTDYIKIGDKVGVQNIDPTLDRETWCVQDTKLYPKLLLMNERHPPLIIDISNVQKLAVAV